MAVSNEPINAVLQGFGLLNRDPVVIHVFRYTDDIFPGLIATVDAFVPERKITFLVSIAWSLVAQYGSPSMRLMIERYEDFCIRYPNCMVIYLANDATEASLLQQLGFRALVYQHNAFLCPDDYPVRSTSAACQYDSVYIGRLAPYKRVELMANLTNSALIYASWDSKYYSDIRDRIAHVALLNGYPSEDSFRILTKQEVLSVVATSAVGLCLSETEGAMFASAEYLLTGVPVVSTFSVGGRDTYWDPRSCFTCRPSPTAVAAAVERARAANISPHEVRAIAIETTVKLRLSLLSYLREVFATEKRQPVDLYEKILDLRSRFLWQPYPVVQLAAAAYINGGE